MRNAGSTRHPLLLAVSTAAIAACADASDREQPADDLEQALATTAGDQAFSKVMTQNLYIGLDVYPLAFAPFDQLPYVVADAWADVEANRPYDRMAAVAAEIALIRPQLVGLQEVVRIYQQSPSDTMLGQFTPNATDEYVDFLQVLLAELAERGALYEVAPEQLGTDIEVPRYDGMVDGGPAFSDMRAQVSDVILRRADTPTSPLFAINYQATLPFPPIPGAVVPRNAIGVTAELGGQTVRFVSTHLEPVLDILPDDFQPQYKQAAELVYRLAVTYQPELPTILVGDFNSPAGSGQTWTWLREIGYTDLWTERLGRDLPGFTCCQDVVLSDPESALHERIDIVWTFGIEVGPVLAFTVGDRPFWRTWSQPRLWPSDHAGVAVIGALH